MKLWFCFLLKELSKRNLQKLFSHILDHQDCYLRAIALPLQIQTMIRCRRKLGEVNVLRQQKSWNAKRQSPPEHVLDVSTSWTAACSEVISQIREGRVTLCDQPV